MKFQGESIFQAPRDQVWAAIVDPRSILAGLSGFQRFDRIGTHEYEGAFDVEIGEVRGDFQGTLELADLKPPSSLRFSLNAMGAAGFIDGDGLMVLEEAGGGTRIHYDLDAKIGGRIASLGQRALEESARTLARKAFNGLGRTSPAAAPTPKFKVVTKQEISADAEAARDESRPPEPPAPPASPKPEPITPASDAANPSAAAPGAEAATAANAGVEAATVEPAPALEDTAAVAVSDSTLQRQGQYGSRASRAWPERLEALMRRPEALGVALVLYTLFVVLVTRACS